MKANADKCHLLVTSDESRTVKIEDFSTENTTEEKLLGAKFDSNLSFENHVTSHCKKTIHHITHSCKNITLYVFKSNCPRGRGCTLHPRGQSTDR